MENPTTYATHTEFVAAYQLIIVYNIQKRLALSGQPYPLQPNANTCDILYSNEHYSTYGTQALPSTAFGTSCGCRHLPLSPTVRAFIFIARRFTSIFASPALDRDYVRGATFGDFFCSSSESHASDPPFGFTALSYRAVFICNMNPQWNGNLQRAKKSPNVFLSVRLRATHSCGKKEVPPPKVAWVSRLG